MRFADLYLLPGVRVVATLIGAVSGFAVGLLTRWEYGLIFGALAAVLTTLILPTVLYLQTVPFARMRAQITDPLRYDERAIFRSPRGSFGGWLLLTDHALHLLVRERGGRSSMKLSREDVRSIRLDEESMLRIFLNETQYVCVMCAETERLFELLGENGWNTVNNE